MLDGKILTAVLASLAMIGTAMNGGHVDSSELQDIRKNPLSTNFDKLMPGSLGAFSAMMQNPEPDTALEAELMIGDVAGQTLRLSSGTMKADNLTKIKAGRRQITSTSDLEFNQYSGKINFGKPTNIEGSSESIITNDVNISGGFEIKEELDTDKIVLTNVTRSKISLKKVSGLIKSDSISTNITKDNLELNINSFSGNMTIHSKTGKMILSGEVDKMDAGSISLD